MCKKRKSKIDKKTRNYVLKILLTNPENLIWVVYILIASISFIIGFVDTGKEIFNGGTLFYISMSIIAPLFIDFLIQNIESKKNKIDNKFLKRKTITLGISVACLILSFIFITTHLYNNIVLQISMFIISIALSLYMFCLNKLYLRYDEYKELDDKPYADEINDKVNELSKKQNDLQSVKNNNGKDIKL